MFAVTTENGQCMAMPDVCETPMAPAPQPIPIPYPNISMPMLGMPTTKKVFICGVPALNKQSKIQLSNGDQAGATGGIMSGKIMGQTEFTLASQSVSLDGDRAVFLGAATKQNDGNAVGFVAAPSQTVVMLLS